MITKTAMALAATFVVGSTWTASSYQLDQNTGLPTEYYYAPISDHAKQELRVREETLKKYAPAQQGVKKPTASVERGSNILLLESRPNAVQARPTPLQSNSNDKHSGHLW